MDRNELSRSIGVIIVTHNSEKSIDQTLSALERQTLAPTEKIIVDSGSSETHYLRQYRSLEICLMPNIGFSAANNLAVSALDPSIDYILFLNPDVILPDDFLEKAVHWMERRAEVAALSGPLLGWNLEEARPTGRIDSTGIFTTWYGRWYDRGQGKAVRGHRYTQEEAVPALCGALLFCRKKALPDPVFDEKFFCYKEDIDLSLRLRKAGWKLYYVPDLIAYHARGWSTSRQKMPRSSRLMSAQNELRLHLKGYNPIKIGYSFLKLIGVKLFDL